MKTEYAFPFTQPINANTIGQQENTGMTLRDYFATNIAQGVCANSETSVYSPWDIARMAYAIADAMLEVRDEANK